MLADMQAGTAPDVFQGCCTWFPTWAERGDTLSLRPFVRADLDKATMGDPEAVEALEWLRARMWDDKAMATTLDVETMAPSTAFAAGRIAMVEDGSWAPTESINAAARQIYESQRAAAAGDAPSCPDPGCGARG